MTLLILFHQSHYRDFKAFYRQYVCVHLRGEFPGLVSYSYTRFVDFIPTVLLPHSGCLKHCFGDYTGMWFIDSTAWAVCENRRLPQPHSPTAQRGKTSVDWFFGFKLHLAFNDRGELLNIVLTSGNIDDRAPVPDLVQDLFGTLRVFADKGYVSQPLFEELLDTFGVQLITTLKKHRKNRLMPLADKLLLRKRAIVETIIDQLKNISQIEHSRHRSFLNFLIHLLCGLIAYCLQPHKPSLGLDIALRLEPA